VQVQSDFSFFIEERKSAPKERNILMEQSRENPASGAFFIFFISIFKI
jgi:hypothetical protein